MEIFLKRQGIAGRYQFFPHLINRRLVFEVAQYADGGFVAEALGEGIFTEGGRRDAVRANVREAVKAF